MTQQPAMPDLDRQLTLGLPQRQGLYDPTQEKDSCGVGFICDIKGRASREIIDSAGHMNRCMVHRGGLGYEKNTGDGAGILTGLPAQVPGEGGETRSSASICPRRVTTGPASSFCRGPRSNGCAARP